MDIMLELKLNTETQHQLLHKIVAPRICLQNIHNYSLLLLGFRAVVSQLESKIINYFSYNKFTRNLSSFLLPRLCKTSWLDADLSFLQQLQHAETSFNCDTSKLRINSVEHVLGCMYVMEGMTLGGQQLLKIASHNLELQNNAGTRFLHGYGSQTYPHWQDFGNFVREQHVIPYFTVQTANQTFDLFSKSFTEINAGLLEVN